MVGLCMKVLLLEEPSPMTLKRGRRERGRGEREEKREDKEEREYVWRKTRKEGWLG